MAQLMFCLGTVLTMQLLHVSNDSANGARIHITFFFILVMILVLELCFESLTALVCYAVPILQLTRLSIINSCCQALLLHLHLHLLLIFFLSPCPVLLEESSVGRHRESADETEIVLASAQARAHTVFPATLPILRQCIHSGAN